MGVFDAYLVQLKLMGPEASQQTPRMQLTEPYRDYRRHELPEGILSGPQSYEIVVESM